MYHGILNPASDRFLQFQSWWWKIKLWMWQSRNWSTERQTKVSNWKQNLFAEDTSCLKRTQTRLLSFTINVVKIKFLVRKTATYGIHANPWKSGHMLISFRKFVRPPGANVTQHFVSSIKKKVPVQRYLHKPPQDLPEDSCVIFG